MKKLLLSCGGARGEPTVLLIDDYMVKEPLILEDICYLLTDGCISGVFSNADWKAIHSGLESIYYQETHIVTARD